MNPSDQTQPSNPSLTVCGDRDTWGGSAHEQNGQQDEGAELQSEVTENKATNHNTTPTAHTSRLLISQVGVSYALFVF